MFYANMMKNLAIFLLLTSSGMVFGLNEECIYRGQCINGVSVGTSKAYRYVHLSSLRATNDFNWNDASTVSWNAWNRAKQMSTVLISPTMSRSSSVS